jgi:predicted kinase
MSHTFESLINRLPPPLISQMQNTIQDRRFHAEGSVFAHTQMVFENIDHNDLNLCVAVIFHDLGKLDTNRGFIKKGRIRIQNIGHENFSHRYIKLYASCFKDLEINWGEVEYAVNMHMRMHKYLDGTMSRPSKRKEIEDHMFFNTAKFLAMADAKGRIENLEDDSAYLVITFGIPGSGKTTWARKVLSENEGFERICPDEIRAELCNGNPSDQSRNGDVWKEAYHTLKAKLEHKKIVIFDATNINPTTRKALETIATERNAMVLYKLFPCEVEEAKRRIKQDIESQVNRSNVPDDVVDRMFAQYQEHSNIISKEKIILYEVSENW